MEPILTIDNLNSFGGNMLRQGDKSQLKYRLRDVGNKNLGISSKSCEIKMYGGNYTTVVYETTATVSSDDTVSFTIDKVLPKGTFYLEFTVGSYIFPTDHREFFEITPSGKGIEANVIEIVGVDTVVRKAVDLINDDPSLIIDEDKLVTDIISNTGIGNINEYYKAFNDLKPKAEQSITKSAEALTKSQNALNVANGIDAKATNALSLSESADTLSKSVQEQFNQVVIDGDSSVEAAQARVDASGQTNPTLKARLDKEHNEVTAQLAEKANDSAVRKKSTPITLDDLDGETLGIIQNGSGGTPIEILSIPRNDSVTYDKMDPQIKNDKFMRLEDLAPELNEANWRTTGFSAENIEGGVRVGSPSAQTFARISSVLTGNPQVGDKLFIRVKMKNLNSEALRNRVMLRNSTNGTIHLQNQYDYTNTTDIHEYFFNFILSQPIDNLMLYVDTIYSNSVVGRETEIYEVKAIRVPQFLSSETAEDLNELTQNSADLFTAERVLGDLGRHESMLNWETDQANTVSNIEQVKQPDGLSSMRITDKYAYPNTLTWGNEYLYSWYKALEDNKDLTMIWSGDSTTYNTNNPLGYKRHELGQRLMEKYGYSNVISINAGHGENTTRNWRDTWSDEDLLSIGTAITDNRMPIYILGWGINDGGLNYNTGTSIQERVERFETALFEGLTKTRAMYTAEQLPIILATPVTTYDLTNKRNNDEWHNHIRHIIQHAARQFQCAFIDLGLYHYDRTYANYWSTGGDRVHPNMYSTKDYMSLFKDLLVPELFERQTTKPNLLPNGDFQGVVGSSTIDGWSTGTMGTGGIIQLMESPWGTQGVNALKVEVTDQRAYLASSTKYPITGGKIYTLSCMATSDALEVWYEFSNAQGERILHETNRKFTNVGNSRYTITLLSPYEATDISVNRIGLGVNSNSTGSVIFERLRLDLGELV